MGKIIKHAFDIIGSREKAIAIIDIHEDNKRRKSSAERKLAEQIMKHHKNISTVLAKITPRKGTFRINDYKHIKGKKDTTVIHKESGCRFFLDPQKAYFSGREATERLRIAELVKKNENIMVFFAGVGPFCIVLGKKVSSVTGIEINPIACKYFEKNIVLNKLDNIKVVEGDVKKVFTKFKSKFNRVLMPLPEQSIDYIIEALTILKKNGICHFYCFSKPEDIKEKKKEIKKIASGYKIKFIKTQKVLSYGPGIYKCRIDIKKL
ncbi:class I SAM-dependent methyltransferase family protein [Candidatus Aenigmatarchaeota archaeon]